MPYVQEAGTNTEDDKLDTWNIVLNVILNLQRWKQWCPRWKINKTLSMIYSKLDTEKKKN